MNARQLIATAILICTGATPLVVPAAVVTLTPDDEEGWLVLESAGPGDVVEIAPGTYRYRVYLEAAGSASSPIVIRAQDPDNRPVWDLVGDAAHPVRSWPGSYTAGDNHRGCWQVAPRGAYYQISDIVFRNCRDISSAGMRLINSGPVTIRNCLFEQNTNGLTGASEDLILESCELRENGKVWEGGNMTHNIYLFGGKLSMRYCYNHDSHEGQLFHIRARESLIEYNWLARPSGYVGDIMTCEYLCGEAPVEQRMTLRGNVIIQGAPRNGSQLIALFNDGGGDIDSMSIDILYNTIIGTPRGPGQEHMLVHMVNDAMATHATLYNNIIYQVGTLASPDFPEEDNWSVSGGSNWVSEGADAAGLPGSLSGVDPGFVDAAALDFTLRDDAPVLGRADTSVPGLPDQEYYRDEGLAMQHRGRDAAADLGAFEHRSGGDTDTEADTGADTDTDSDNDTDIGSDADTDSDTDANIDTDLDADPDTVTDAELNLDSDTDTDVDTDTDSDNPGDSDTETEPDTVDIEDAAADGDSATDPSSCACSLVGRSKKSALSLLSRSLF